MGSPCLTILSSAAPDMASDAKEHALDNIYSSPFCFDTTDRDVLCGPHRENIGSFLYHCLPDNIYFFVKNTMPNKKVQFFSYNKTCFTPELKALLNVGF